MTIFNTGTLKENAGTLVWSGLVSRTGALTITSALKKTIAAADKLIIKVGTASAITETIELQKAYSNSNGTSFGRSVATISAYYSSPNFVRQTALTVSEDYDLQSSGEPLIEYRDIVYSLGGSSNTSISNNLPAYLKEIYVI